MRNIGVPEYSINSILMSLGEPDAAAHEQSVMNELMGDVTPQARHAISESERARAREDAAKYERMMREQPQEYWKPENQRAYREALERSLAQEVRVPTVDPAPAQPAPAPGQAAPTAPPASPAGTLAAELVP